MSCAPSVAAQTNGLADRANTRVVQAPRILYASNWTGRMQIFAVDPSGRAAAGQLTFGTDERCSDAFQLPRGYDRPLPSPNGRYVLYRCSNRSASWLWVARADGRAPRLVATAVGGASWSPDSKEIVFSDVEGLHVVRPDGTGRQLISEERFGEVAWSPTGRSFAGLKGADLYLIRGGVTRLLRPDAGFELAWSPNGRWIATWYYRHTFELRLTDLSGAPAPSVGPGVLASWSPDSRRLAYEAPDGLRVLELRTGVSTLLTRETAYTSRDYDERSLGLGWAPDGRSIAYVAGSVDIDDGIQSGDLRAVSLAGRSRTIVAADRAFGGRMISLAWTRPPAGLRYRRPEAAPATRVAPHDVLADGRITELAADGRRVSFVSCLGVFVWTPARGELIRVQHRAWYDHAADPVPCYSPATSWFFYSLALAGERVAWAEHIGCMSKTLTVGLDVLAPTRQTARLATGHGVCGGPFDPAVGGLMGAGDLLVFSTWREREERSETVSRFVTSEQTIQRIEPSGCPCPTIGSSAGPYVPADVEGGRILVYGDNETRILDREGRPLLSIPVSPLAAQLSGSNVVLLFRGRLDVYDAFSGALRHSSPLPDVPSGAPCELRCDGSRLILHDATRDLAVYVLDGRVRVRRLGDGTDIDVAAGTKARFMDTGLVYADGWRLHLVPFNRLPLS